MHARAWKMRQELSNFLVNQAGSIDDFVVLSGDHGYALFDELRKVHPSKFINVGVCEQAMIGYAAGLSKCGFKVIVYGLSAFLPTRVFEFVKMDICYDNLPVILLGDGAGLVYNTLGASHQCAEDIAMLRALPNLDIYSPADAFELLSCLELASKSKNASYIRIGKSDKPTVNSQLSYADAARGFKFVKDNNSDTLFIATGSMVSTSLEVSNDFNASVVSFFKLSNFDKIELVKILSKAKRIVTLEEHSINGGLGSLVSEVALELVMNPPRILRVGINNRFTEKCGSYDYAILEHELDAGNVRKRIAAFLNSHSS